MVVVGDTDTGGLGAETFNPSTGSWTPDPIASVAGCADVFIELARRRAPAPVRECLRSQRPPRRRGGGPRTGVRTSLPAPARRFVNWVLLADGECSCPMWCGGDPRPHGRNVGASRPPADQAAAQRSSGSPPVTTEPTTRRTRNDAGRRPGPDDDRAGQPHLRPGGGSVTKRRALGATVAVILLAGCASPASTAGPSTSGVTPSGPIPSRPQPTVAAPTPAATPWAFGTGQIVFEDYTIATKRHQVWIADGIGVRQLVSSVFDDARPSLSPDGRSVLFTRYGDGPDQAYLMGVDGSNLRNPSSVRSGEWSGGRRLVARWPDAGAGQRVRRDHRERRLQRAGRQHLGREC